MAVRRFLAMDQFGTGKASGAETVVHLAQSSIRDDPDLAVIPGDVRNAFGEVHRSRAMEAALELVPALGLFLLALWGTMGTP
eukprot:4444005-Lingulodinium_polyedra.AAC.1